MIRKKILSWGSLKKQVKKERARKKTVVFTNGCFDLIHIGHLKVFKECKKRGDVLIVALNSDASVRRLKGPKRPIIPQQERAQLIAGLEVVDFVTFFNEDTPLKLIKTIQPDILAKGGDWKSEDIIGRELVKKVVRIPLIRNHSTTSLINRIVDLYGR